MNLEQGQAIDDHYDSRLQLSLRNFNYLECTECHDFIELHKQFVDATSWRFSLMGLRPSLLSVAKGICPKCQQTRKQMKGVFAGLMDKIHMEEDEL